MIWANHRFQNLIPRQVTTSCFFYQAKFSSFSENKIEKGEKGWVMEEKDKKRWAEREGYRTVMKDRGTKTEKKVALIELEHVLYPNVGLDNNLISSQTCHVYSGYAIKQTPDYRHNLFRSSPNHGQMLKGNL